MEKIRLARLDEAMEISPGNTSILTKGWKAEFYRVGESDCVTLSVRGERGGLKARLWVSLEQLKEIVPKLEGTGEYATEKHRRK